jgi:hypothetical protein
MWDVTAPACLFLRLVLDVRLRMMVIVRFVVGSGVFADGLGKHAVAFAGY